MDEKPEQSASVRLQVLVNGKERAVLGVQSQESILVVVTHTEDRTELMMLGGPRRPREAQWHRGTVLYGIGDEVLIRLIGPGTYEEPPTKFFPLPPQPGKQEGGD